LDAWTAGGQSARQSRSASRAAANRAAGGARHRRRDPAGPRTCNRTGSEPDRCGAHRRRRRRGRDRAPAGPHRRMAVGARRPRGLRPHLGAALMPERTVQIVNKNGLHARPAAEIVKLAAKYQSDILVARDDLEVNGKSIMGVMMLAAECGSTLT